MFPHKSIPSITYVIRVCMTAKGHTMLSKGVCSDIPVTSVISRNSVASDDSFRKCDNVTFPSFRAELEKACSQAFNGSSSFSSRRVITIKIRLEALLALYARVTQLISTDTSVAQIFPVLDVSLWQGHHDRLVGELTGSYCTTVDNHAVRAVRANVDDPACHSISQYIESLFALLRMLALAVDESTADKRLHLRDQLGKILKNFLEANQGGSIPPAPHLISPISNRMIDEKNQLVEQCYRCCGCGSSLNRQDNVDSALGLPLLSLKRVAKRNYAYCHYYRAYYCTQWCHLGDKRAIPRSVVLDWNKEEFKISSQAAYFIDSIRYAPLFNVSEVNPRLYKQVPIMMRVFQLKMELSKTFKALVLDCTSEEALDKAKRIIKDHPADNRVHYFVTDSMKCDWYSLDDLLSMHAGTLSVELTVLLNKLNSIRK